MRVHPLAADVAEVLTAVAAAAREADDDLASSRMADIPAMDGRPAGVVVVGEKKRGKSSLINALVERPGLLPVDADVASCVHVAVGYAAEPVARVVDLARPDGFTIALDEVAEYAGLDPDTQEIRRPDVSYVEIGLPHPTLVGLSLTDTPGVGGLVAGHGAITLAAVEQADAIVFVVHGGTELTESERQFLERVAGRVSTVLFVLGQIDKYPDWRAVLETNRRLLAEHAPALAEAPWFPVSSLLRTEALEFDTAAPDKAAALRAQSRFDPLLAALRERVADRTAVLRLSNSLHSAAGVLPELIAGAEIQLATLRPDPTFAEDLAVERERLRSVTEEGAAWRKTVAARFRALEQELSLDFNRGLNDVSAAASLRINDAGPEMIDQLPADLLAGVHALWSTIDTQLRTRVSAIVAETAAALPAAAGGGLSMPGRLRELPGLERGEHGKLGLASAVEYSMGSAGVGLLTAGLVSGIGAPFAGIVAGLGAAYFLQKRRKLREQLSRDRAAATRHLNVVMRELQVEFTPALKAALTAIHDTMEAAFTERLTQRRQELQAAVERHERAGAQSEHDLRVARADAADRVERLVALAHRVERLQDQLT
ncbi:dynamin family protein [Dactylosporangium cerinum]|uniref:Dynamin family protein n=1 Tax=Dactylosporangium cerinum TaxID=1434730 RepID=A0ABV9WGZ7_9ACTN